MSGAPFRLLVKAMWLPTLAAIPMWFVAHEVGSAVASSFLALTLGSLAGLGVYGALCYRWVRRLLPGSDRHLHRSPQRTVERRQAEAVT